jgi:predicted phosphodiesterase
MTKIALFSDIHANAVAFRAVLDDIERVGVDHMICLGDTLQAGPQPCEVMGLLQELNCPVVLGNADALLLEVPLDGSEKITDHLLEVREWTLEQIGDEGVALIRRFEPTVRLDLAGTRLLCFHGSPKSFNDILYPGSEQEVPPSLEPFLMDEGADLMAGGHTHRQWTRTIGDALFVNPGTVGAGPDLTLRTTIAEYALIYIDELGLSVRFKHIPYSLTEMEQAVREHGLPRPEQWLAIWRGFEPSPVSPQAGE